MNVALLWCALLLAGSPEPTPVSLQWRRLPDLPDARGFAGVFAGVTGDALVVAGGTNFPDRPPWEGGVKAWHDGVFVLESPGGAWRRAAALPRPNAHGVALTTPHGVLCAGGGNANAHYAEVFLLSWRQGKTRVEPLPPLPAPRAFAAGALLGGSVYIVGGIERPLDVVARSDCWRLDLTAPARRWEAMPPLPAAGRILPVAGAQDGALFVFSGAGLRADAEGRPQRVWLRDAWRLRPGQGWSRVADTPRSLVAAPSPALALGETHLAILGGDDGSQVGAPPDTHRGFSRGPLVFHTVTGVYTPLPDAPTALVATPVVKWGGGYVVPGGEIRPGVRGVEIWEIQPRRRATSFGLLNYATLVFYLAAMPLIAWWTHAPQTSTDEYFKAGAGIPWWAAGLSIYATMLSSITFMSLPAKAFVSDWTFVWANVPILVMAPVIATFYLPFFRRLNVTSAYEYLERRFNLPTRLYGSAAFTLFQLGRQAIVLYLPAQAVAAVCDFDTRLCIVAMGVVCTIYTLFGGMRAVIWTDVAQSVVLLGAALLALALVLLDSGVGPASAWSAVLGADKLRMFNLTWDWRLSANAFWAIFVGNLFFTLIPYTSDQAVVQRYLTTRDTRRAARAIYANALLAIPSTILFFAIGTALFVFYQRYPGRLDVGAPSESIFPLFIVAQMPAGVAGLVLAGLFAATQSTVSSGLNSMSAALVTDYYRRLRPGVDDAAALRLARWLTAMVGVFATLAALLMTWFELRSLWDVFNGLLGLLGSGLAGLFALGVFTRRATGAGALTGVAASAVTLVLVKTYTPLHFHLYSAVGFVTCFAVGYLASLALPSRSKPLAGLTWRTLGEQAE